MSTDCRLLEEEKMSDKNRELSNILETAFSRYGYPEDFLADYDQMELLAERGGRETFLCQKKGTGELVVAKCYENSLYQHLISEPVIKNTHHDRIPSYIGEYKNDQYTCILREYVPGRALSELVREKDFTQEEIISICVQLADILIFLHGQDPPVIHRDVKPENIIISEDGTVNLIDLDISRTFKSEEDSDTFFYGTRGYAPPEQYGFAQTDARADIYSFGVLLRFMLTGSIRDNKNIRVYGPLQKVITKCTAFSPEKRYPDMKSVKKALLAANPRSQMIRIMRLAFVVAALSCLVAFAGYKIYKKVTYTPFTASHIPGTLNDEERIADGVKYMREHFGTDMFDDSEAPGTVGFLHDVLIDLYGLDPAYACGINTEIPRESEEFFLPWGWDDGQFIDRDTMIYVAVKLYDPSIVEDWSCLKDDNGYYPGLRVAVAFAEKYNMDAGANRPLDITKGEMALILANADRVFAEEQ